MSHTDKHNNEYNDEHDQYYNEHQHNNEYQYDEYDQYDNEHQHNNEYNQYDNKHQHNNEYYQHDNEYQHNYKQTSTTTSTTTTTSSSTTTSTTTTQPILPRCQAVSDVIESIALQQTALSHILNAEGEKLQKIISIDDISYETILKANRSVESMVNSVSDLEAILKEKLALFEKCGCRCSK